MIIWWWILPVTLSGMPITTREIESITLHTYYEVKVKDATDIDYILVPIGRFYQPGVYTSAYLTSSNANSSIPLFINRLHFKKYSIDWDEWGNVWLNISGNILSSDTQYFIEVITSRYPASRSYQESSSTNISQWLQPSKYIEPYYPPINESAWKQVKGVSDVITKAKKLNTFVNTYLTYNDSFGASYNMTGEKGGWASEIYERKDGVCRHFARLFVSMCRAVKIPARLVHGYVINMTSLEPQGHEWAEILDETNTWHPSDPTSRAFDFNFPYYFEAIYSPYQTPFHYDWLFGTDLFYKTEGDSVSIVQEGYTSNIQFSTEIIASGFVEFISFWAIVSMGLICLFTIAAIEESRSSDSQAGEKINR